MNRMNLLALFSAFSCALFSCFVDEIAVTPQDFPQNPKQLHEQRCGEKTKLNAIVLLSAKSTILPASNTYGMHGLISEGLKIPGEKKDLEKKIHQKFIGRPITQKLIVEIEDEIQSYYRAYGRSFVATRLPEQDISNGVLQLYVVEAYIGQVTIKGEHWSNPDSVSNRLGFTPGQNVDEKIIYEDLQYLNKNPFRNASVTFAPGQTLGETQALIDLDERRPLRIYAGTDNSGVDTIGRERLYTGLNYANMFNAGHMFSFQYTTSYNFNRFQAWTGQYLAPLPWKHTLNLYGGYSVVNSDLPLPSMRSSGFNSQASIRYAVPFAITRFTNNEWLVGFDWKRLNNTLEFVDQSGLPLFGQFVNISQFVFEYVFAHERSSVRIDAGGGLFYSPGKIMSDQSDSNFDSLRPGAKNNWVYGRVDCNLLTGFANNWSWLLRLEGQLSSAPLLPNEQFTLGGHNTVRGYEEHAYNGDNAVLVVNELHTPPFPLLTRKGNRRDALQLIAFIDYGYGQDKTVIPMVPKTEYLLGIGPGIRYAFDPYLSGYFDWGIKLHKSTFFGGGDTMIHFGITLSY